MLTNPEVSSSAAYLKFPLRSSFAAKGREIINPRKGIDSAISFAPVFGLSLTTV